MGQAAPQAAGGHAGDGQVSTRAWCRKCLLPVTVTGMAFLGLAVHTATGLETGDDGHLAAPIDERPELRRVADAIEARYPQFAVSARFGFLRADWRDAPAAMVALHYEADDEAGLCSQLDRAVRVAANEAEVTRLARGVRS